MKKTVRYLFLFALLFIVAGAFAVSCQKGSEEEDVPEVGAGSRPNIIPSAKQTTNMYTITADGTTISATSSGYSFTILAKELTFKFFTCYLVNKEEKFSFINDCNLTLHGGSTIILANRGFFGGLTSHCRVAAVSRSKRWDLLTKRIIIICSQLPKDTH
jgi:hypothetical protein